MQEMVLGAIIRAPWEVSWLLFAVISLLVTWSLPRWGLLVKIWLESSSRWLMPLFSLIGCYLRPGSVSCLANKERLRALAALLLSLQGGWLVFGDWNCTPSELEATGWLDLVGGECFVPQGISFSCRVGARRLIDFCVILRRTRSLFRLGLSISPWKAHAGFDLWIKAKAPELEGWRFALPVCFLRKAPAKAPPNPFSKTSRKKLAASALRDPVSLEVEALCKKADGKLEASWDSTQADVAWLGAEVRADLGPRSCFSAHPA